MEVVIVALAVTGDGGDTVGDDEPVTLAVYEVEGVHEAVRELDGLREDVVDAEDTKLGLTVGDAVDEEVADLLALALTVIVTVLVPVAV